MLKEDNSGFVNFPISDNDFTRKSGKTLIYLVAFDVSDMTDIPYVLSNISLKVKGEFISDDINQIDSVYFQDKSIPLTTCICLGWSEFTFKNGVNDWYATFRDLSNDGRNLYYSIRKLHNNKEVRLLTFVN